jgi:hypothetical protein
MRGFVARPVLAKACNDADLLWSLEGLPDETPAVALKKQKLSSKSSKASQMESVAAPLRRRPGVPCAAGDPSGTQLTRHSFNRRKDGMKNVGGAVSRCLDKFKQSHKITNERNEVLCLNDRRLRSPSGDIVTWPMVGRLACDYFKATYYNQTADSYGSRVYSDFSEALGIPGRTTVLLFCFNSGWLMPISHHPMAMAEKCPRKGHIYIYIYTYIYICIYIHIYICIYIHILPPSPAPIHPPSPQ